MIKDSIERYEKNIKESKEFNQKLLKENQELQIKILELEKKIELLNYEEHALKEKRDTLSNLRTVDPKVSRNLINDETSFKELLNNLTISKAELEIAYSNLLSECEKMRQEGYLIQV